MKKVTIRIAESLCHQIQKDLSRPHEFALERVGFVSGQSKETGKNEELIIINEYFSVADKDYIADETVGARINGEAIRKAMQLALSKKCSIFHVHEHIGRGAPIFSQTDLDELPRIAEAMINANPRSTHGVLLLSEDKADVLVFSKKEKDNIILEKVTRVGFPTTFNNSFYFNAEYDPERYSRQSFLGQDFQLIMSKVKVCIVGLGGGGSHIVQQLSHLGVTNFVLFDNDTIEKTNLNRLVSGNLKDSLEGIDKTVIARRVILGLHPNAQVEIIEDIWQNKVEALQQCDVVLGAVDSFIGRRDLESECRRYLIPYIDVGIDVRTVEPDPPRLFGQVILSLPGCLCMTCMGFLSENVLAEEAQKYGDAGSKPQVVWANGVVASNAVGVFVDLFTGWTKNGHIPFYQEYDGNIYGMKSSTRLKFLKKYSCPHFSVANAGPIKWN
ncbi:HesA/MoeB/ThiF family protein [Salinimicrobium sp. CAU 1759]